jgi:translation initiation factor IF-3
MRRNEQIRISPVRLISDTNEQLGVFPTDEALRMAQEAGMDLVEVAANVRPPVCRIMDYGKWKYNQKKKVKKSHEQVLKEVRLRPKTDDHDRSIKVNQAIRFFKAGHKVQFTMRFRGRERAHREIAFTILREIAESFGPRVRIDRPPSMDGRNMVMVLSPTKVGWDDTEVMAEAEVAAERVESSAEMPPQPVNSDTAV